MSDQFLGEIKLISFNFPPRGWAFCNGQLLPINQNQALFSILGTTYGGNGQTNFALPDLRGRAPIHFGDGFTLGQRAGAEAHTISVSELPAHTHQLRGSDGAGTSDNPFGAVLARAPASVYGSGVPQVPMAAPTIGATGGSQAHENRQPLLTLNFIIALQGIFPSAN